MSKKLKAAQGEVVECRFCQYWRALTGYCSAREEKTRPDDFCERETVEAFERPNPFGLGPK